MPRHIEIKARTASICVLAEDNEPAEAGIREAEALMARLGIEPSQLIEAAYVDLLAQGLDFAAAPRPFR
jgi:hypothetical protein